MDFSSISLYEQAVLCRWNDENERKKVLDRLSLVIPEDEKTMIGLFDGSGFYKDEVVKVVISDADYLKNPFQLGSFVVLKACLRHVIPGEVFFLTENADGHEVLIHGTEVEQV